MRHRPKVYISPGLHIVACRIKNRKAHYRAIGTASDLHSRLCQHRKQFLGSSLEVEKLICCDSDVEILAEYLGKVTAAFLRQEYSRTNRNHVDDDWCHGFYIYSLHLLAQRKIHGCLDDLIELAQAYEISHNTMYILWTENLPLPLSKQASDWCMEHDVAPTFLTKCVTAAIAVMLGVMPEPEYLEEE